MTLTNSAEYRLAMRNVPTCVSIATARDRAGGPVGVTIGSLSSLSLEPILLLWSLQKTSRAHAAFEQGTPFAVCVLGTHQSDLALRFSDRDADRFRGCSWASGTDDTPLIEGCAAYFQGRIASLSPGGDHTIFVGTVATARANLDTPLIYHNGRFAAVKPIENYGAHHG
jgi:flavin reductase (DIM6/NTAB) family NADH-FMN oxidoreductase RutF